VNNNNKNSHNLILFNIINKIRIILISIQVLLLQSSIKYKLQLSLIYFKIIQIINWLAKVQLERIWHWKLKLIWVPIRIKVSYLIIFLINKIKTMHLKILLANNHWMFHNFCLRNKLLKIYKKLILLNNFNNINNNHNNLKYNSKNLKWIQIHLFYRNHF
jgi:hypothetical protein